MNLLKLLKYADLLGRYLDLVRKLDVVWHKVADSPPGWTGHLPTVKTRINGRMAEVGPTPIHFLD